MIWLIVIIAIVLAIAFVKPTAEMQQKLSESNQDIYSSTKKQITAPHPETANPKEVIFFISNQERDIVKQVYNQFKSMNISIPANLDAAFKEKIKKGFLIKQDWYWKTNIEAYQTEKEQLGNYKQRYSFELKGIHIARTKNNLKECIIYDQVYLEKEPGNKYDKNAIKVVCGHRLIGRVPANETSDVISILSKDYKAFIDSIFDIDGYLDVTIIIYYN